MKYGLLKYNESINLGDEIQSLAAKQYLPRIDEFIDRDSLNHYSGDQIKVILNGWFMSKPENWPPDDKIVPLFISFHLSHYQNSDKLLADKKLLQYYKRHEPIGCRDRRTMRIFQSIGVDAYYSGCLTLTLPPRKVKKTNEIILVDPFYKLPKKLQDKYIDQLIPENEKHNIVRINQHYEEILDDQKRFEMAEKLLDRYAGAKLVFTSRIHCAMPCLALGTPVYFLDVGFEGNILRDRFDGVIEYFRVLNKDYFPFPDTKLKRRISKLIDISWFYNMKDKPNINWAFPSPNPVDISAIQKRLRETVQAFI